MHINRTRETLLEELRKLLPEKGTELNFLDLLGESLSLNSSNNINASINAIRRDQDGKLIAFGDNEDDSCGASVGEFFEELEYLPIEDVFHITEMAVRALQKTDASFNQNSIRDLTGLLSGQAVKRSASDSRFASEYLQVLTNH